MAIFVHNPVTNLTGSNMMMVMFGLPHMFAQRQTETVNGPCCMVIVGDLTYYNITTHRFGDRVALDAIRVPGMIAFVPAGQPVEEGVAVPGSFVEASGDELEELHKQIGEQLEEHEKKKG